MNVDVLLAGGGLANSLIAWRLAQLRPGLRVVVIERGASLGGGRSWGCHAASLGPAARVWLAPLISHAWTGYAVQFPRYQRVLPGEYLVFDAARIDDWVRTLLGPDAFRFGVDIRRLAADGAVLDDGTRLRARVVIDGRGWPGGRALDLRRQSVERLELELATPHDLRRPLLVDATVPPAEGYALAAAFPLDTRRVLVAALRDAAPAPPGTAAAFAARYAQAQGWQVSAVRAARSGAHGIVLGGDIGGFLGADDGVARVGARAALFHPVDGAALPDAARVAALVAADRLDDGPRLAARLRALAISSWRRRAFYRQLNRTTFESPSVVQRRRALRRLYAEDAGLVERFHAERLGYRDRMRLAPGGAPRALAAMLSSLFARRAASG